LLFDHGQREKQFPLPPSGIAQFYCFCTHQESFEQQVGIEINAICHPFAFIPQMG
jgi:hypothetical protein